MTRPSMTAHRRRVLTHRHRDRVWQASLDVLFDRDGMSLFYLLCLAKEGVWTREEAFTSFEETCEDLLAVMAEARPTEAAEVEAQWRQWFADYPR